MNNRRTFFKQLAVSVAAIAAPTIFIPKLIEVPKWKSLPNPNWVSAPYEIAYFNHLPFYLAKMEIARNADYVAWHRLMEGNVWKPTLGNTLRAIN